MDCCGRFSVSATATSTSLIFVHNHWNVWFWNFLLIWLEQHSRIKIQERVSLWHRNACLLHGAPLSKEFKDFLLFLVCYIGKLLCYRFCSVLEDFFPSCFVAIVSFVLICFIQYDISLLGSIHSALYIWCNGSCFYYFSYHCIWVFVCV